MEGKAAVQTKAVQAILQGAREVVAPERTAPEERRKALRTYYMNAEGRVSQRRGILGALLCPRSRTCRASTTARAVAIFKARFPELAEGIHAAR